MKPKSLAVPHIQDLQPYQSARRIGGSGRIWINANELPYPRTPYPAEVLDASDYHRYPDTLPDQLHAAYADYAGVPVDSVLATRGADEGIDLLIRTYASVTDSVIINPPTYGMYEVAAQIQDCTIHKVALNGDWQLDVAAIQQTAAVSAQPVKLIFICQPNNPTGNALHAQDIIALLEYFRNQALVVVDEAYFEFCPSEQTATLAERLTDYPNLVIVRTLSKAFGLAGVHVGFILAAPSIIAEVSKVIQPYPIAEPCAQIALAALTPSSIALMQQQVADIAANRKVFVDALQDLPAIRCIYPSVTNFVLVDFHDIEAAWQKLLEQGIVARRLPSFANAIRFSIARHTEMDEVVAALKELSC